MNKLTYKTEGDYRCVYINGQLSKRFHIMGNDFAYKEARDYGFKYLGAKTYPIIPNKELIKVAKLTEGKVLILDENFISIGTVKHGHDFSSKRYDLILRELNDSDLDGIKEVEEFRDNV